MKRPLSTLARLAVVSVAMVAASARADDALPLLQLERNGAASILHWPLDADEFDLQRSIDLLSPGWSAVEEPLTVAGTNYRVTVPDAGPRAFFRLRRTVDFYGRKVGMVKLFGQTRRGDAAPGLVTGAKIFHSAGVLVDRSVQPNRIYVADTGNNRILGFQNQASATADRIFGQPDNSSAAANGDCNLGIFGPAGPETLCLLAYPSGTNVAEQWMRLNFDTDAAGNLYVPDLYNNRVLMYRAPFSTDTSGGKGDAIADAVWGQSDFTANGVNRGLGAGQRDNRSLFLSAGGFDHVSARGISVDDTGNLWVADTFNYRVLRFPAGSTTADLVLGAPNFTVSDPTEEWSQNIAGAPLDRVCTPTLARINPDTGELYVIDEYPGGFPARILVFTPPFSSGMAASRAVFPQQPLSGDFAGGYRFTHATGLIFNTFKTNDLIDPLSSPRRYNEGVFWVHDGYNRTLLCDAAGQILQAIGAPDTVSHGGSYEYYGRGGQDPVAPYHLNWPGGMMGIDSANNIVLADEAWSRVARYALPYTVTMSGEHRRMPDPAGGMFGAFSGMPAVNAVGPADLGQDNVGAITFQNQLIARDHQRYLVWNDYLTKPEGAPADLFIGQTSGSSIAARNLIWGRSMHAIDHLNRLWMTGEHGKLMCWQLPFVSGAAPLRTLIPFYWADAPADEVDYRCSIALTFEPATRALWVFDGHHRLLRVRIPEDLLAGKFIVDAVIGQSSKVGSEINRGMAAPDASSLGDVNGLTFDRHGNLYVVDNTYEGHLNGRVIAFAAADLAGIVTLFPPIAARWLYVTETFGQSPPDLWRIHDPVHGDAPFSPVCVAFNSRNEMVIANDGYYRDVQQRLIRQLYLYRTPGTKFTPDAVIELPLGAPGEIHFDADDNLVVQDHTWNKVWIINFDADPSWLKPLPLD